MFRFLFLFDFLFSGILFLPRNSERTTPHQHHTTPHHSTVKVEPIFHLSGNCPHLIKICYIRYLICWVRSFRFSDLGASEHLVDDEFGIRVIGVANLCNAITYISKPHRRLVVQPAKLASLQPENDRTIITISSSSFSSAVGDFR